MSEFQIGLVASLDSSKSKQQLNSDIEALKKQLTTVEVQAKLGKDVVTNLTQQLNAVQINLNNVKVDQTAINNMISQFNTAFSKVNINLGNINTNGATQSAQKTGQQIGNQLGNSINQSLQANLNHVKQDIQNIFSSFSVQKLNNADIFKNFNLNRAKIDPSVTKDVQSLTAEINKLAREALKTNSDSAWEGITQKISNLSDVLNKFGATRDLSSFKEQMDLLDYFQGKKIFVGDKAEAIQNTGMSIRELNNQFRNLGVTFTTVENGSTKLDEIWSELFNIKPSFQGIDSFGGQINAVVNELKIAKEAMYGDSNLMPAQRTGATTTYLNAWLEMLEKLSQRIEILKTEQANLQNQMAQASNNATNAVVANQQKQQQAYQQTGSVIQAVTSNTSVIGNMPKEASDIGDAKNQLSQLLQNEKAVIATTQHFDNDGMMRTFTLNVKRATGEVESLNYAFRQVTDNNGNVTDTYFENTGSHLNDSGAIEQIDAIEEAFSDYTTKIAKFKSTNAEILSGLDTPLKDFETKLAGLKTGASTVNEVKSAFNSLNTEAAKITQNFSKQLSPIDRAVSKIANGEETIKGLRAELKGLDNAPKDLSKELNQCAKALQKVKDIEANEGRTENWSKAYKQWAESIDTVTSKIKTLKKEQSNVASTQVFNTSDLKANNIAYMSKVHNTIEKQMVEIKRLANANGWSDVKVTGVEEASGKIQKLTLTVRDAEGALKQFNMQREKIQGNGKAQAGLVQTGDVKVLETAVQYAEKLKSIESSMGQFGNTTTSITNLEKSFTKLGLSTDEVNSKMEAVKTEYATLQNMMSNGASGNEIVNQFEKVNSVLKETQNSLKQTKADYSLLATEYQRLTLANDIEEWNQKNTAATREVIAQNEIYISSLRDLDVAMTKVEHNNIATSFKETENSMRGLGKLGASITDQFKQAIDSFKVWVSATTLVMGAVTKVRDAVTEIKDINDILTEISKTSDITQAKLSELGKSAYDHASKYGLKASNWLTGVQEMNRSGFYGEQGTALADTSTLAQSAGDMTAEVANNWILATNAAYKYEGEAEKLNAVLDGTNEITNRNSVNMTDMADAMTIVGSNAANTGVKVDELSSIIGTAVATTKKSGSEVGTAFKTIFVNLQNTSSDKILNTLKEAGTSMTEIKDGAERLRSPIAILKDLAKTYNSLDKDDPLRADITRNIGGKHYANVLGSTLDNFEQYSKMLQDYSEGDGSAMEEAQKSAHNLTGELNTLGNTWTSTVNNIINADDLTKVVRNLNSLLSAVDEITGVLGTTGTIGVGAGLIANAKNVGLFNMIKDNDSLSGQKLVTSLEARKVAQEEVVRQLEVDIQCLKAYETECQKGEVSTETFASTMKGASVEAQKYAVNIKEGTGSAETFATNQKAIQTSMTETATVSKVAAAGLSIFKAALNTIIIFAAVEGIQLLINAFDNLVLTVDEAEEARSKAVSDLSEAQSNLESINSELETTQQRIDELNEKDKLTFTEQGELEDLKEKNKLLQLQADAAERIQKSKQQDLLNTDSDNFNKLYKDKINKSDIAETKQEYKNSIGALNPKENDITGQIAQLQLLQDQYADLATQVEDYNDQYGKEHGAEYLADDMKVTQGSIDDVTSSLNKQLETLLNMQNDYQSVGIDNLTSTQKEEYEQIANAIKLIYSSLDPSKYNEISVQDIFDTKDIETTKDDLIELAQAGKLDEKTLNQYPKLTKAIKDADLITKDGTNATKAFINAIIALGDASEDIEANETNETPTSFSTLFDGSDFGDRISYLSQQFQDGKISAHDYFESIRNELANTDFSEFTDQAAAAQQFFTDSTQQVASSMSNLINSYNKGEISATEYLDGYTSMAETLSALTDDLQNNSAAWNENGEAISDGTNQALDNAQSDLASAIEGINQYQDSIYSLEQITSGAITAGSDEFTAHAQVIAEDLAYIVQNGGYMADQIASTMGTTTSEIANSLTNSVDNQALASQAIAGNTNASIEQMANAVSTLFAELGSQIGNFKATINFAPKVNKLEHFSAIKIGGKEIVGGEIPNLTYDIKGSSSSLKSIGSAISSFGKVLSSNIAAQKVDYKKFSTTPTDSSGKERKYTPSKGVTNNYNNKLKNNKSSGKSGSGGSGGKNSGGDAEKQNEEYLDKFMAYQKARLEAGKITYQQYSQYVSDELERMYKNGEISANKYYSAVKDMIDEQKSIYDAALKGVTKLLDDEIDKWQDKIDVIEKSNDKLNKQKDKYDSILSAIQKVYDDEIEKANKKKDSIQDIIDAMSDENDEYERQKKLQEAIYNLNKANSQKTKYLLKDGQFVYSTDNSAIRDAQDSLHDAQYDVDVANLKKQQDDIDNYIDTLNEFKDKWNEISDAFSEAQDTMNLKQYLGSEYQRIILSNNLADIENFKNQYVAVESQINSNEQLKTSYEEKVDYYNNLKQQWEDCTSKYDDEKNKLYASQILGANWEAEVLSGRQQTLANFTSEYEKLCQRQADATVNAYNTEVQAAKNAAAGIASVSSSVASSGGGSSSGGSSGGSSSSTHKVTYDKNNNPNKPALKSNDYWTYEKLSKKGYSTSGQASSQISNYASKGANGFTQIGNKYFIVKWIANAGSPANASKAKNKLEKDNPKKKGKYGYAKRYHKGLELGKIEALPKDKAFDLVQDVGTNGLEADEVPIIAQKGEAVLTEEQIENLAKTLHLVPVQNEIMEKMSKISLGDLPMNTPKMNFDTSKVGQSVTRNNFAPSVNITFNCPNLTNESGVQYVEKAMDKYMNKFANDFYQASLHYVNRKQ